jgi:uncharacterized phage protein (TIGR01671 family)
MREIKFRGKQVINGEWITGNLLQYINYFHAQTADIAVPLNTNGNLARFEVDSETVGQYTGLKDKNGTEIYEGDKWVYSGTLYTIRCLDKYSGFFPRSENGFIVWSEDTAAKGEVVGNIHDTEVQP